MPPSGTQELSIPGRTQELSPSNLCISSNAASAFPTLLRRESGVPAPSTQLCCSYRAKEECGSFFIWFCLREEMLERIRLLQLVPVRYSRYIRACSYLQIAVFSNHCT